MITADSEGVGLNGPPVSWQWAIDDGKVRVHYPWEVPARDTLRLFDRFCEADFVNLWNATFDWFQAQRMHNVFSLLPLNRPPTLAGWLRVERKAIDGPCLKPNSCFDGFLHARKGPWQSLMDRKDVRIRRVPRVLAPLLAEHLTSTSDINPIYFSRRGQDGAEWEVSEEEDEDFPDVVLKFGASAGLKPISRHTGVAQKVLGRDVTEMDEFIGDLYDGMTKDTWNPFVKDWHSKFDRTRKFWLTDPRAKRYMVDDVLLTRGMREHFGNPPHGDDDSVLACQVGSSRWRGYGRNGPGLEKLLADSKRKMELAPRAWREVLKGLHKRMNAVERLAVKDTRSDTLAEIAGMEGKNGWTGGWDGHPAQKYARKVVTARSAEKTKDYCEKLLTNERGHPDFRVIATLSNRMGGTGGLNWQAFPDVIKQMMTMSGGELSDFDTGDFWAFEVTLMAAIWKDERLIKDLESGHKIHALFGSSLTGMDYDDIYDDETETPVDKDAYDRFKRGFFGKSMGAQAPKLAATIFPDLLQELGIKKIETGLEEFERRYPGIGIARKRIEDAFCSMRQPGGIGTQIVWHEPAEFVDSLFGRRRYFTLENNVCRTLYHLAQALPASFRRIKHVKVSRRAGRIQTPGGACQSAVFAAAFNIQARAMRSAANHEIQASGATWTKEVQREIWDLQPPGVHPWNVQPLNEHDSVPNPRRPSMAEPVKNAVHRAVERRRKQVPLGRLDWKQNAKAWK